MKKYTVTQTFNGYCDFQHIEANSREEAQEIAERMLEDEEWVNYHFYDNWFAEVEEEE